MNNPLVNNRNTFTIYILIWIILAIVHSTILILVLNFPVIISLVDSLVFNFTFLSLGLSFGYSTKYISFETFSSFRIISNHITAAFFTSGIWSFISYFILKNIFYNENNYLLFLYRSIVWRFMIGMLFYIIIVSIIYVIIYYRNFQEKTLHEAELKSLVKEAELKSLKYQINPHFIFNSLNSISSLILTDSEKAREMTIKLSSFLRKTLSSNDLQKCKLLDELNNAKLYLDIEKIRFGDKFNYQEKISELCETLEVPNMIFQPIFENAIKHGVYESIEPVTISFNCYKENEYIKIDIKNNYDTEAVPRKGEGIGLSNIQSRLRKMYNQENLLRFSQNNGIFKVTILIPII
ncbi:MAG: histidine kinase [Ignavibacteriae bacterium]|nr:MAG: histidine kinase [Ignavibacteriota bacterium]